VQSNLGFKYFEGTGVAQNDEEALRWYRNAKDQGYTLSHNSLLGFVRNRSKALPQSDMEAMQLYRKAADQGDAKAQFVLVHAHAMDKELKNVAVAHKYLSLSAAQGNEKATQEVLSNLLPHGAPSTTQPSAAAFSALSCARCGAGALDLMARAVQGRGV